MEKTQPRPALRPWIYYRLVELHARMDKHVWPAPNVLDSYRLAYRAGGQYLSATMNGALS